MKNFNDFATQICLLSNEELEALSEKCENLIKDRNNIKRKNLKKELIANLQSVIGDVLINGFTVDIENMDNPNWIVRLEPHNIFSVSMEDTKR